MNIEKVFTYDTLQVDLYTVLHISLGMKKVSTGLIYEITTIHMPRIAGLLNPFQDYFEPNFCFNEFRFIERTITNPRVMEIARNNIWNDHISRPRIFRRLIRQKLWMSLEQSEDRYKQACLALNELISKVENSEKSQQLIAQNIFSLISSKIKFLEDIEAEFKILYKDAMQNPQSKHYKDWCNKVIFQRKINIITPF